MQYMLLVLFYRICGASSGGPSFQNSAELDFRAAIVLHNYFMIEQLVVYCPSGFIDGEDRNGKGR